MYKIERVQVDGFWHRCNASSNFNTDVNIVIGKNGTGKTTFMEILRSVLVVDLVGIGSNDFDAVEIILVAGEKKRTVKAKKVDDDRYPYGIVEYQISRKKYKLRLLPIDDRRNALSMRRHLQEATEDVRRILDDLVSVSSLSVYRLRNDDDLEVRDRHGARLISPVDYRLSEVLSELTTFQLSISQRAREIAVELQKDVLTSILYNEDDASQAGYTLEFEREKEKEKLISAYSQLNAIDLEVRKKITFHVDSIDRAFTKIKTEIDTQVSEEDGGDQSEDGYSTIRSLEAHRKTRKIIDMSLAAEEKTKSVFAQVELFLSTIGSFISDKGFRFDSGKLVVSNEQGDIPYSRLSSGEKQLLILLTEALLQDKQPHVFLADEPELSLHIEWQRMIIPAIRELNPEAQVIAATHSPEVAANYGEFLKDMEDIICG